MIIHTEIHPWQPFVPDGAKILFLGSFPPPMVRWSMDFYYPNITNDFWKIMGLLFWNDRDRFVDVGKKLFKEGDIKDFLASKGIALYDTARVVRRLKNNASDKFLEVVERVDIVAMLASMPDCRAVVATGQKSGEEVADCFACAVPQVGGCEKIVVADREVLFFRAPSTSRAYPLAVEKKAVFYRDILAASGIAVPFG